MAGSYKHCTKDDGSFREDTKDFCGMIENLGDAREACEMMHWMINYLAGVDDRKKNIDLASEAYYSAARSGTLSVMYSCVNEREPPPTKGADYALLQVKESDHAAVIQKAVNDAVVAAVARSVVVQLNNVSNFQSVVADAAYNKVKKALENLR